ncbi:putative transcription factor C2C2-YABBY family [Helianthus debilis subsp. tardiflorus]
MRSAYFPLHVFSSVDNQENPNVEASKEDEQVPKPTLSKHSSTPLISSSLSSHEDDEDDLEVHVVKPLGKRQRAPCACNRFIKEEIRRLKTQHPEMTHKQAFSVAEKMYATTLTRWHLVVTYCTLHVAHRLNFFENKRIDMKTVILFGILNGVSIGFLNLSLGFNSIGFYQVIFPNQVFVHI